MGIKDIDLNKDGVTLGDHIKNLFDGDDTNSNNVVDRVSHQMMGSNVMGKIDELTEENNKRTDK